MLVTVEPLVKEYVLRNTVTSHISSAKLLCTLPASFRFLWVRVLVKLRVHGTCQLMSQVGRPSDFCDLKQLLWTDASLTTRRKIRSSCHLVLVSQKIYIFTNLQQPYFN